MTEKVTLSLIGHPSSIAAYYNKKKKSYSIYESGIKIIMTLSFLANSEESRSQHHIDSLKTYKVPTIYF